MSLLLAGSTIQDFEIVHVVAIELSAKGSGGSVHTQPRRLGAPERTLAFGEGACREFVLADRVLEQLFVAMDTRRPVVFDTQAVGEAVCVRRVKFLSPRG